MITMFFKILLTFYIELTHKIAHKKLKTKVINRFNFDKPLSENSTACPNAVPNVLKLNKLIRFFKYISKI